MVSTHRLDEGEQLGLLGAYVLYDLDQHSRVLRNHALHLVGAHDTAPAGY